MQGPKPAPEEELRQLLLCGAVVDAAARLRQLAPSLADNQWLVFQLKKHQFMHVAAAAAGASKEAQAHQLHEALGALPDGGGSSGSEELSEFAGMVVRAVRAVRQQAGSFADSQLAQLLRYLLLLHRHQAHTGFHPYWWPDISQQTHQLCARLLLPQHDALPPAALEPADDGSRAAEGVREHDVQARRSLMHQQRQPGCCGSLHGCPALPLEG